MAEEKVGILQAVWRLFSFWKLRKALGLIRAADRQFTGSSQGISDAFDIQQDTMVKQFKQLRDAIAQVETILEEKRSRLEELNKEEEELIQKREGALAKLEEAKRVGDTQSMDRHVAAFERFDGRILEIDAAQEALSAEIKETNVTMSRYMAQLTKMQSEIEKLPRQKAEAIAEFISAQRIIELNERLAGIQTSIDKGPIEAVLKANKELSARAKISEKLTGADVTVQDMEYSQAGKTSTSKDRLNQMLAARQAEREGKTGQVKTEEKRQDDRPQI